MKMNQSQKETLLTRYRPTKTILVLGRQADGKRKFVIVAPAEMIDPPRVCAFKSV